MLPLPQILYFILLGPLYGLIALSCFGCPPEAGGCTTTETERTHVTALLLDWTYFILSLLLLFVVMLVNAFGLFKDHKSPVIFVLVSLTAPGLPSIFHALQVMNSSINSICEDYLLASLSIQLAISALAIACLYGKHAGKNRQKLLDVATGIFLLAAVGVSAFTLRPSLTTVGHYLGLCGGWHATPSDFLSPKLPIFVGYVMQLLLILRYHTKYTVLPQYVSRGYIFAVALYGVSVLVSQVALLRMVLLCFGALAPLLGLLWEMATTQRQLVDALAAAQHSSLHWQSVAKLLQEANAVTESSINSKSAFISGLANEMRTIAHSTSVLISLLNDTDIQPNQNVYISKLEKAIERLANLIREAQFYAEVESQKASIESVFFRLDQLLEEVIASTALRTHFEERDVDVAYLIDPLVPLNLMGDYGRLKNLLLRLLTNAIKSTIQGEILILVKVETQPLKLAEFDQALHNPVKSVLPNSPAQNQSLHHGHEGETVLLAISVEDTGTGIAPEDIERIFDPFGLVNHKREDGDLGLGLSICKQLARLFGGTLNVQSEVSKGTIFTLLCPFRASNPLNASTVPFNVAMMGSMGIGSTGMLGSGVLQGRWGVGKTVCVIDDSRSVGAVCRMHLDPVGCEVLFYSNPVEALNELKVRATDGRMCDVILIDYRIPGYNGEEIARSICNNPTLKNIPVVLLCTVKQRKLVTLPNVHFLYKPLKKEPLLTVVHMLCTSSKEVERIPDSSTQANHVLNHTEVDASPPLPISPQNPPPSPTNIDEQHMPSKENPPPKESIDTERNLSVTTGHQSLSISSVLPALSTPTNFSPVVPHIRSSSFSASPTSSIPSPNQNHSPAHGGLVGDVQAKEDLETAPPTPRVAAPITPGSSAPPSPTTPHSITADDGNHPAPAPISPTPTPTVTPVPSSVPAPTPAPVPVARKETILLVEDNPINAKIASAVLRRHTFEVELASNGQVALERVKKNHDHFQLILMDIHMPVMDGLTCAYLVRQFEKENSLNTIPIIALTADTTPGHRTACLEAGCNEFMSKPLDYPLLIEILKKLNPG